MFKTHDRGNWRPVMWPSPDLLVSCFEVISSVSVSRRVLAQTESTINSCKLGRSGCVLIHFKDSSHRAPTMHLNPFQGQI